MLKWGVLLRIKPMSLRLVRDAFDDPAFLFELKHDGFRGVCYRPVAIKVVFKFKPDKDGWDFLSKARAVIESAGSSFRHEVIAESYDN